MNTIEITIHEDEFPDRKIPRSTAQTKRFNFKTGNFFDSEKLRTARNFYTYIFNRERMNRSGEFPITGPIMVEIYFYYKTSKKKEIGEPKTTRPDLDNSVKLCIDCLMSANVIKDDGQIYMLHTTKKWWYEEKLVIKITVAEEQDILTDLEEYGECQI